MRWDFDIIIPKYRISVVFLLIELEHFHYKKFQDDSKSAFKKDTVIIRGKRG